MTAKEILKQVKAKFFGEPVVPAAAAAPAPQPAPAPPVIAGVPFKLKDGTDISIAVKDPSGAPAVGDAVTVNGAPAPDGELELQDGSKITVASGAISVVTPIQPVTQTPEEMAAEAARIAALATPTILTAEAVQAMYAKFATGSPEERIANLEIMIKALMECNFGYQIRQGQEAAAIQTYKDTIAPMQTAMAKQTSDLELANAEIVKHKQTIEGLFELCEKLSETPTADPATLTGNKKEKFEKQTKRERLIEGFADGIKKLKEEKNK